MKHGPEMLGYVGFVCVLTPISLSRSSDPFLSSAYCGLTSINNQAPFGILPSLHPLFSVLLFFYTQPSSQPRFLLLISLSGPYKDEWLHYGCGSVFNFLAQRIHNSDLTPETGSLASLIVWGPAAFASLGRLCKGCRISVLTADLWNQNQFICILRRVPS